MKQIRWGIIGCGEVTEVKSGPAFYKSENSSLTAVMRRDGKKAEDYAKRHKISKWYDDAGKLINDPEVDIVYIATPPSSHDEYAIMALNAGKPVYIGKPMALNYEKCLTILEAAEENSLPVYTAYYRRCLPYFLKIKELIDSNVIGKILCINIELFQSTVSNGKDPGNFRIKNIFSHRLYFI